MEENVRNPDVVKSLSKESKKIYENLYGSDKVHSLKVMSSIVKGIGTAYFIAPSFCRSLSSMSHDSDLTPSEKGYAMYGVWSLIAPPAGIHFPTLAAAYVHSQDSDIALYFLATTITTNLASGIFEIGRMIYNNKRRKLENLIQ